MGPLALSSDGRWLVCSGVGPDRAVVRYDLTTGDSKAPPGRGRGGLAVSGSARVVVLQDHPERREVVHRVWELKDEPARVWDVEGARVVELAGSRRPAGGPAPARGPGVHRVLPGRDRPHLAAARRLPGTGGPVRGRLRRAVRRRQLLPDGRLVAAGYKGGQVRVWDTATGAAAVLTTDASVDLIRVLTVRPDADRLLVGGGTTQLSASQIRAWSLSTGEPVPGFEPHRGWVASLAASADARIILTTGGKGTVVLGPGPNIQVWDGAARQFRHTLRTGDLFPTSVTISADGRVAAASLDELVMRNREQDHRQLVRFWRTVASPIRPVTCSASRWGRSGR